MLICFGRTSKWAYRGNALWKGSFLNDKLFLQPDSGWLESVSERGSRELPFSCTQRLCGQNVLSLKASRVSLQGFQSALSFCACVLLFRCSLSPTKTTLLSHFTSSLWLCGYATTLQPPYVYILHSFLSVAFLFYYQIMKRYIPYFCQKREKATIQH